MPAPASPIITITTTPKISPSIPTTPQKNLSHPPNSPINSPLQQQFSKEEQI